MADFLMLSLRTGEIGQRVALAEHFDVRTSTGLDESELDHVVLDSEEQHLPNLSSYRGVIVGGSSLNITDHEPIGVYSDYQSHIHSQLGKLIEHGVPVFLLCFGSGWLTHHTGGSIDRAHPENSGPTQIELLDAAATDPLTATLPRSFTALTGHTESIRFVGSEITVLATGPTCPFQIIRYRDHVWGSQAHCEMNAAAMRTRMSFFMDYGYFPAEEFEAIVKDLPRYDTTHAHQLLRNFVDYCRQS